MKHGPGRAPDWTPFCYCNRIEQLVGGQEVLFGVGPILRDNRRKMFELRRDKLYLGQKNKMQKNLGL